MEIFKNCLMAFLLSGGLCLAGQLLIDVTHLTPARILVGFVVLGVVLGALGVFEPLLEHFGCGASVPLIGFGNLLAKGVKEAVDELGALGILSGGLSGSAAGISAAISGGLLAAIFFRSRIK